MTRTPRLVDGRLPVLLKLLSPAQRPVQITADLESFWRSGYADVRKDLRGRYPKHYWPEDPRDAVPTRRTRPPATPLWMPEAAPFAPLMATELALSVLTK